MSSAIDTARVNALCPTHNVRFELKTSSLIACNAAPHVLGSGYPASDTLWEFCQSCLTVWPHPGRTGTTRCLYCDAEIRGKRLCSRCSVVLLSVRQEVPTACPGCFCQDGQALEHVCEEVGAFSTSRSECPFCKHSIVRPSPEPLPAVAATAAPSAAVAPAPAAPPAPVRRSRSVPVPARPVLREPAVSPAAPVASAPPLVGANLATRLRLVIIVSVTAIASLLYIVLGPGSFASRIDAALADKRYFAPPGNSVYDIYMEEARENPASEPVRAVGGRIRAALEPVAHAEVERFYRDSVTDLKWDELERYYAFLAILAPEARDIQVRYAYAEGQRKLNKDRDHRGALAAYSRALELDPKFALALNGIAKVYVQDSSPLRDEVMAVHYYRQASEADPNFTWPLKNLGEYHMRRGEWNLADAYMTRALSTSPERPSILMSLGRIRFNQRRYAEARDYYTRARPRVSSPEDVRRIDAALERIGQKLDD